MSKVYSLKTVQIIPAGLEEAWNFFSNPENLAAITPKQLGFSMVSHHHNTMYAGQLIEYTIKPLFGISLYWMTEITHVQDKEYFVDEQRFGPYAFWHHQHHFKQIHNAVEMTDIVHYKIPFWFIGDLANTFIVRKKLRQIFEYRYKVIEEKYGVYEVRECAIEFS
jgi:ligand-binding SRPBCC domain-containing protein